MAEKAQPQVKIGHYIIGDTLGVGTFGKVKSMQLKCVFIFQCISVSIVNFNYLQVVEIQCISCKKVVYKNIIWSEVINHSSGVVAS